MYKNANGHSGYRPSYLLFWLPWLKDQIWKTIECIYRCFTKEACRSRWGGGPDLSRCGSMRVFRMTSQSVQSMEKILLSCCRSWCSLNEWWCYHEYLRESCQLPWKPQPYRPPTESRQNWYVNVCASLRGVSRQSAWSFPESKRWQIELTVNQNPILLNHTKINFLSLGVTLKNINTFCC